YSRRDVGQPEDTGTQGLPAADVPARSGRDLHADRAALSRARAGCGTMICADQPRTRLVHLPTPLEPAPRLSRALGIDLWIKREDLAGLCVGGNKSRLLEFVIGSRRAAGVDTLIAHAAAQSNKLRDVAAAAARCGMQAVLLIPHEDGLADEPHQ